MAVTGTQTYLDIVNAALRKIGVVGANNPATAAEAIAGMSELNRLLKAWQRKRYSLWLADVQTVTLTTAASYTLSPERPLRINNVNMVRGGIETPMQEMTRDEYRRLPLKTSTGVPTCFYYDKAAPLLYVWPVLATADDETLIIDYEREFEDVTSLSDTADIPGEYWDATVYGLAARLADDFSVSGTDIDRVVARAAMLESETFADDREGSVFFAGPDAG